METLTIDREALLNAAAKKSTAKSNTPAVAVDDGTAKALRRLIEIKRAIKDLEAEKTMLEADHFPGLDALRCQTARQTHKYTSSIKAGGVTFMAQRNWQAKIPHEQLGALDTVFGAARAEYLPVKTSIEIDEAKVPTEILVDLIGMGATIKRHMEVTEKLVHDAALLPAVAAQVQQSGVKIVNFSAKE